MFTLQEFQNQAANIDFQRNNLFSVVFATTPSNKSQALLDQFGGALFNNIPVDAADWLGLRQGDITQGITTLVTAGTQKIIRKSGVSKYLIGAMSNRVVQSLLGEFEVGTYLIDFFNMAYPTAGLMVNNVKVPDNTINYEMSLNHNAPNIKIGQREYPPLVINFRMDSEAANYRAMNDWVNAVKDPVTGLVALPEDVEADIQVNLHSRNGIPHTVVMMTGCVPVSVSAPELAYDSDNTVTTFDVTFAYRYFSVGAVGKQAALEWVEDKAIGIISRIDAERGLSGQLAQLSRLSGAQSGMTNLLNTGSKVIGGSRLI